MPLLDKRKDNTLSQSSAPVVRMVEVTAAHEGQRLDNFLIRLCKGVPKSHLYKAVRAGSVRVNRSRTAVDYRLQVGDVIRVPPFRMPAESSRVVPAREFPVVFEDDAMLVIDKPAGTAVHGGSGVSFGVIEAVRAARPTARFLELVHRLDRDTSGLLILAKQRKALLRLHEMMRDGVIEKHYLALVQGRVPNDRQHLRFRLTKWSTPSGERRVKVDDEGQTAHTIVTCLQRFANFSLVDAQLQTGRTHQIRVHLAASGHPIVGDEKYGDESVSRDFAQQGFRRMFLHAKRLSLTHPLTGQQLTFEAPLPDECRLALKIVESQ